MSARRVLIIDDERDMQVYLKALVRKAGFEATVAADGDRGFELACELRPQLITLDVMMPGNSGVSAYERLRSSDATRQIPIVVVTGMSQPEGLFGAGLPGPDAVVDKPIDRQAFLARVEAILREQ